MMRTVFEWKRHDDPDAFTPVCYPHIDPSINNVIQMTNKLKPPYNGDLRVYSGRARYERTNCFVTGFTDGTGTIVDKPIG